LGTAIALPMFEAMRPALAFGGGSTRSSQGDGPMRMAWFYVPNGVDMPSWTPQKMGTNFDLPATLKPLAEFRDRLLVLSGLTLDKARANGDGPGDHARAQASFLTGCQARKTGGANIRVGISVDQLAAQKKGHETPFRSLELGLEGGRNAGVCDSGYACAYQNNFSWRTETTPMPKEIDPRAVFERLFGSAVQSEAAASRAKRDARRKSILDLAQDDTKALRGQLGGSDVRKLDEYLSSIREVEQLIDSAPSKAARKFVPDMGKPEGMPREFAPHCRVMFDLLALAFRADLTRIATFAIANDGSNRNYPAIGVGSGHHEISHHGKDRAKIEMIKKINLHHMEQFAYFLGKLKATEEGDSNLLDRSAFVYGSGIGDGDRHNHDDLPILLVGGGNGTIKSGRHLRFPNETPLTNLYLAMLERFGTPVSRLGDSTGVLKGLS
jgi:hypothetical protein